jgi:hypothetical protein
MFDGATAPTHKVITLIAPHTQKLGLISLPPTTETYLSFCGQSLALQSEPTIGLEVVQLRNECLRLIGEIGGFWQKPKTVHESLADHPSLDAQVYTPLTSLAPIFENPLTVETNQPKRHHRTTSRETRFRPDIATEARDSPNTLLPQPTERHDQMDPQHSFLGGALMPSIFDQGTQIATMTDSLTGETDEDTLFNSLAVLDPIDW